MDVLLVTTAAELRRMAGQDQPPFSTRQMVEARFPDALVTGSALPEGVDELVTIGVDGPTILYRRGMPTPDQRLAIAHAMAHLLFDDFGGPGCRAGADDAAREERADAFAFELLVPLEELRPYVGAAATPVGEVDLAAWLDMVDELASHFHVPSWVISKRIGELVR